MLLVRIFVKNIIVIILFLVSASSHSVVPEWHMINVNQGRQGDAHLLIDEDIVSMIDAGDYEQGGSHLVPYLRGEGVTTIHHFFVSHPHRDHYKGLDAIVDAGIRIENVYFSLPDDMLDDFDFKRVEFLSTLERVKSIGGRLEQVSAGMKVKLSNSKFNVIHAQKERVVNGGNIDTNDYSLIIQWDAGDFRTIFTGDLNNRLGAVLAGKDYVKADILKMPHHGVTGIAPNVFFNKVDPSLVMFPSTRVLWSHPRGFQARKWTETNQAYYCNNGLNGDIVLKFDDRIHISPTRSTSSCFNGFLPITPGEKIDFKPKAFSLSSILQILFD